MRRPRTGTNGGHLAVSATLFTCLFAGQAALIVMSPVLADAAGDLDVSTAAAGQLRTITGLAAGVTALALGLLSKRIGFGAQLLAASVLVALGSAASAAAPSFVLLALAQLPIGIAVAVLTTTGTLAAAEWVAPELRTRVLSWALVGQPAAWIVGMPLVGVVGEHGWRYGWLALPLPAAVAAALFSSSRAARRPAQLAAAPARVVLGERTLARWLASELFASAAWAGLLVYSGALLAETYGLSSERTGALLAIAAAAFVAGTMAGRRLAVERPARALALFACGLAVTGGLFGAARTGVAASVALLSVASFVAGGRTLVASAYALATAPELRPTVTGLRAATMQFGFFGGSLSCGAALSLGGYGALGAAAALLFVSAAAVLAGSGRPAASRAPEPVPGGVRIAARPCVGEGCG